MSFVTYSVTCAALVPFEAVNIELLSKSLDVKSALSLNHSIEICVGGNPMEESTRLRPVNPAKNIPIISRPSLCRQDSYELPCISHYKLMVRKFVGIRHENVENRYLRCHPASWGLDWSSFSDGQWLIHYRTVNNIKSLLEDIHGVTSVGHSTRNLSLIGSLFKVLTSPNLFLRNAERSYLTYKSHWNALSKESKIRKQNKLGTKRQTIWKICSWTQRILRHICFFFFSKAVTQKG